MTAQHRSRASLRAGMLALSCCSLAGVAQAHAPQARRAALTPDASAIAISLPGFGVLMRTEASPSFAYICDALLDDQTTDIVPSFSFLADGSLLLSSINGVRIIAPDSCPLESATGDLSDALVVTLAVAPGAVGAQVAYAAVDGDKAGLWRSGDSGRTWQLRSPLSGAQLVTTLLIAPEDPDTLYMSQGTPQGHSVLLVSSDGGATFTSYAQDLGLTLLHGPDATTARFWALDRSADNTTNRGFDLLHADSLQGPWLSVLRVNYFGGFTIAPDGTLWIGDEGGGVYRSQDHGDTFSNIAPKQAVACLQYAGDALWGCTPGLTTQPALAKLVEPAESFAEIVAFADVDHLVTCDAAVDVPQRCAAAWIEWRRDVRMENLLADAGVPPDAATSSADASVLDSSLDAGPDAEAVADARGDAGADLAPATTTHPHASGGCSTRAELDTRDEAAPMSTGAKLWLALSLLLLVVRVRRSSARPTFR